MSFLWFYAIIDSLSLIKSFCKYKILYVQDFVCILQMFQSDQQMQWTAM